MNGAHFVKLVSVFDQGEPVLQIFKPSNTWEKQKQRVPIKTVHSAYIQEIKEILS